MSELAVTYAELRAVDTVVAKATGISAQAQIDRIERLLWQYVTAEWTRLASRAIAAAVRIFESGGRVDEVMATINGQMRRWAKLVTPRFDEEVAEVYRLGREWMWRRAQGKVGPVREDDAVPVAKAAAKPFTPGAVSATYSFDVLDEHAIAALQRGQRFWIGRHYDETIARTIRQAAEDVMVRGGQNRAAAGRELEERLRRALLTVSIPSGYTGSAKSYFEGVVANATTTARTHGQLRSLDEAGIVIYEFVAIGDDRTCEVCSHMDGKTFEVRESLGRADRAAAATSPDDVRRIHPWVRHKELLTISPKAGRAGSADSKALAGRGFSFPPLHFRCRCAIDMDIGAPTRAPRKSPAPRGGATNAPARSPVSLTPATPPPPPKPAFVVPMEYVGDVTAPDAPFDRAKLARAFDDVVKKTDLAAERQVRKELNALLLDKGMVSRDVLSKGFERDRFIAKAEAGVNGTHWWNGKINVNPDRVRRARDYLSGTDISASAADALRTVIHESVHGHSPMGTGLYQGAGQWLEEATTEMAARKVLVDDFGRKWSEFGRGGIGSYHRPIETLHGALHNVLGIHGDELYDAIGAASVAMRGPGPSLVDSMAYAERFMEHFPLPDTVTAKKTAKQIAAIRSRATKAIHKALGARGMTAY